MKKLFSLALCAAMLAGTLASCANVESDRLDPAITLTSSDARANAEWLDNRLDEIPDDVVIGIGSDAEYGIDMSDFESDGYILREMGGEVLIFGASADGLDRAVRKYAKAAEAGATAELDEAYHEGYRVEKLTVAGRDISEYTVVYDNDRATITPGNIGKTFGNAAYAAGEFVRLVEKATGVTLPITDKAVDGPTVSIGYLEGEPKRENSFAYRVENGNIYIDGCTIANGCTAGVYYFLEKELGWEELMFGDSYLAEAEHIDIQNGSSAAVDPMFDFIDMYHNANAPDNSYANDRSSWAQGYYGAIDKACHGMTNNDWAGGTNHYEQICYTSESNYENVYGKIYTYIENRVASGSVIGEDFTTIDISAADTYGYCLCASCAKIYREEGGVHSGAVVRFANRLADDLGQDYPGIVYQIFAYHGTNIPCKTKPNDFVYITFCTDGACANHALDGSECTDTSFTYGAEYYGLDTLNNNNFAEWIAGWGELSDNVYVWHYALDCVLHQYTMYYSVYDDMQYFKSTGVKGIFFQSENNGLGLSRLRHKLVAHCIWNPDETEEEYNAYRDEVMEREYGAGYSYVQDFIQLWRYTELDTGCWNCWGFLSLIGTSDHERYSACADEMLELLDMAHKLCLTAKQERAVERLYLEVLYRQCYTTYFAAYDAGDTATLEKLSERYDLFCEMLIDNGFKLDPLYPGSNYHLSDNLEDAAWIDWVNQRDALTPEGTVQRPAPVK